MVNLVGITTSDPNTEHVVVKKWDQISYRVVLPPGKSSMEIRMLMYVDVNQDNIIKNNVNIVNSAAIYNFSPMQDNQPAGLGFVSGTGSEGGKLQIWLNNVLKHEVTLTGDGFTSSLILN